MSIASHGAEDEYEPPVDFTAGSFLNRRDPPPLRDLINNFSELYLDSDNDNECSDKTDIHLPPPPPDDALPVLYLTDQFNHGLTERVSLRK